jgi:hypothetical protein
MHLGSSSRAPRSAIVGQFDYYLDQSMWSPAPLKHLPRQGFRSRMHANVEAREAAITESQPLRHAIRAKGT